MNASAMPLPHSTWNGSSTPAIIDLVESLSRKYHAEDALRKGICLLNAGRFDEAVACFRQAHEGQIDSGDLSPLMTSFQLGNNRPTEIAKELEDQLDELCGSSAVVPRIRHALILAGTGKMESAVASLREGISENPDAAELHFQLGLLLAAQEQFDEAELRFSAALSIDRDHAQSLVQLALCRAARQATGDAFNLLQRAQALCPDDARIGLLLGLAAKVLRQEGHTAPCLAQPPTTSPEVDQATVEQLSDLIHKESDIGEAFLSVPSGDIDSRALQLLLLAVDHCLERSPSRAELHHLAGSILNRLGRTEEAIARQERAVALNPRLPRALFELAKLYLATDRREDASQRLQQAIQAGASYPDIYFLMGNIYESQGRIIKARSAYKRALALNCGFKAARDALSALGT